MRYERLMAVIEVTREMGGAEDGLTLDEIASLAKVGRRTAERIRDLIAEAFGPLEIIEDGKSKRFRLPARGIDRFLTSPTADEIAELENAIRQAELRNDLMRAGKLKNLSKKIAISLRGSERRRIKVDTEAILSSETFIRHVGPHLKCDPQVITEIHNSLLRLKQIEVEYVSKEKETQTRSLIPYGLLYGSRYYLVATDLFNDQPKLFRVDRIKKVKITDLPGCPPESFDLDEYVSKSFGVFHEEPYQIELMFDKSVADDAINFDFHPKQVVEQNKDGAVHVSFRASGLLEIARHLMTWGDSVRIMEPERLRDIVLEEAKKIYEHHL